MASKRGNGEGNIRERTDGRWEASVAVEQLDGKRKRHYVYGATRAEAASKLDTLRQRVRQGQTATDATMTLEAYLTRWLAEGLRGRKATTVENYGTMVRLHITPTLGTKRLDRLTPLDVERLVNAKSATHSASSVRLIYAVLHKALAQAVRWNLLTVNPAANVDRPSPGKPHERFLTPAEADKLLSVAREDRLYALIAVALAVGLRRGEALGLRWDDVDLTGGRLTVNRTLSRVGSHLTCTSPKSGKGRTIPLPAPSVRILEAHKARQNEERLRLGDVWQDHGLVFPSRVGTPAEPRNVLRAFQVLVARAELDATRFHSLRHSCGALLVAQGVHLQVIADILGHSDIRITSSVYAHVGEELQRDAADRMATALNW